MERRTMIVVALSAVAIAIAAIVGAGSKDSASSTSTEAVQTAPAEAPSTQTQQAQGAVKAAKVPAAIAAKPVLVKKTGTPPTTLVTKDLVSGSGPAAKSGDAVVMRYIGADWKTNKVFDASWNSSPNEFPLTLGQGTVIACWETGVVGMKVGGRRELICPPDIAYGAEGRPPSIAPNSTLVFVVDLIKIG
ncbi:MAG: FKBP-type peptidyl-prolyl cis-trans isomerase [Solirubrobacterales bacterium]|nr:FKBP-type peptidyl-prolyl cis-trans isomerase [Solirubrobacterales bacterium]